MPNMPKIQWLADAKQWPEGWGPAGHYARCEECDGIEDSEDDMFGCDYCGDDFCIGCAMCHVCPKKNAR